MGLTPVACVCAACPPCARLCTARGAVPVGKLCLEAQLAEPGGQPPAPCLLWGAAWTRPPHGMPRSLG